jgi:hypothetical protein
VTGGWRKLHNEELHNLYSSPNIIRVIKSRGIRWGGGYREETTWNTSVYMGVSYVALSLKSVS